MKNEKMLLALVKLTQTKDPVPVRRSMLVKLQNAGWIDAASTITPAGREAVRQGAGDAESSASMHLGNYNASMESGRPAAAERHLERSQKQLDIANILRRFH